MWFRRLRCSFCRRSDKDVAKLVAGASGYICDKCAYEVIRIMENTPSPTDD
jgi:ATP-dependent protease Clp ATPase subunit